MKLTRKRMLAMETVDGLIRFEVTGAAGFTLLTRFGAGPLPAEPDATIRMDEAVYRDATCAPAASSRRAPSWKTPSTPRATCRRSCSWPSPPWRRTSGPPPGACPAPREVE